MSIFRDKLWLIEMKEYLAAKVKDYRKAACKISRS